MSRPLRSAAAVLTLALVLTGCGGKDKKAAVADPATTAATATTSATPSAAPSAEATPTPSETPSASPTPEPVGTPSGEEARDAVLNASALVAKEGSASFTLESKAGPVVVRGSGTQSFKAPVVGRTKMSITGTGQQDMHLEVLLTPKVLYIKFPAKMAAQLPGKRRWLKMSFTDMDTAAGAQFKQLMEQSQQSSPDAYLRMLTAAEDIEEVGEDTIRGQQAKEYAGTIDTKALTKKFTAAQRKHYATMLEQLEAGGKVAFSVWVGADGLPRRIRQKMTVQGQPVDVVMDLFDFGKKVNVTAPPAAQTTDYGKLIEQSRG